MYKRTITVKNTMDLVHCWPDAPLEVAFLRNPHRHMMHIYTEIDVYHNDRELEFLMVQNSIKSMLDHAEFLMSISCEQIAECVIEHILNTYGDRSVSVRVMEDDENGATVSRSKED